MKMTIKNTSKAPQGVHGASGKLETLKPGEERTVDVLDAYVGRVMGLSMFEVKDRDKIVVPEGEAVAVDGRDTQIAELQAQVKDLGDRLAKADAELAAAKTPKK